MGGVILCIGILAITFGSIFVLGRNALDKALPLQIALIFGFVFLLFLFQKPQAGIALLLIGGILIKPEIGTGTQSALNAAILLSPVLIGVWLLNLLFHREQQRPISSPTIMPVCLFMIVACLAFLVGQYPWFSIPAAPIRTQLAQLLIFIFSGLLFLVAACQLQELRWLKAITYLFIGIGFVQLLPRIVPAFIVGSWSFLPQRVAASSMFWTWLVALSFGQVVMNRDLRPSGRLLLVIVAATAMGITLAELGWMSGWAPPLMAMLVILFLRYPIPVLLASPILVIVALMVKELIWGVLTTGDNLYSYSTRAEALKGLLPIIKANPLLGVGPANYYHYTILNPIIGWYVKYNSHNNYVDLVAQTGLLGLTCFLWFAWAVGRTAWSLRFKQMSGFEHGYVCSIFAGLLATLAAAYLGDWVIPFVYNTGLPEFRSSMIPWIFMGGLVALEQRWVRKA
jgi:hypothetical protein